MNRWLVIPAVALWLSSLGGALTAQQYDLQFMGVPTAQGYLVQSVTPGGAATRLQSAINPAQTGALEPNDLVVAINGISINSGAQLQQAIASLGSTGGQVRLTLRDVRTGLVSDWMFQAANKGFGPGPPTPGPATGAKYELKIQGQLLPGQGIQITSVTPGGPATRLQSPSNPNFAAMENGDVIVSINGFPVLTAQQYEAAMASLAATGGRAKIGLLDVRTGSVSNWTTQADLIGTPNPSPNPNPGPGPGPGPNPNPNPGLAGPGKIHILLVGMSATSSTGFNSSVKESLRQLNNVVDGIQPGVLGSRATLADNQCTAPNIIGSINSIPVSPNDSIFVYYVGHGANDVSRGHYFDFPSGQQDLPRATVENALASKHARLSVFISESCNRVGQIEAAFGYSGGNPPTGRTPLEVLLSDYRGVVDVNSTTQGQLGWGTASAGGFFTAALTANLLTSNIPDWSTLINTTGQQANDRFLLMRNSQLQKLSNDPTAANDPDKANLMQQLQSQTAMTPQVYQLNVSRN